MILLGATIYLILLYYYSRSYSLLVPKLQMRSLHELLLSCYFER